MRSNRRVATKLTRGLALAGAGALALHGWRLGLTLFGPPRRYQVDANRLPPVDSPQLRDYLANITGAPIHTDTRVGVLTNGDRFYAAELKAIRSARGSINLEAYEFQTGEVTRAFLDALIERARAGIEVRVVVDAIGSWRTPSGYFRGLTEAGGRFAWYHPLKSKTWPYLNNRTHRKLLTVDGRIGFIGGAGFADHWVNANRQGAPWRDTMLRVEGGVVSGLNATFAENWLETTGEILAGAENFQDQATQRGVESMVVTSTPKTGTTRARILYQALLESACKSIHITTPYFVPDRSARLALERAAGKRGVSVKILTAGPHSDHKMTRKLSHMLERRLIEAGAEIHEYQPSMIHAKLMTIDGLWTVAGSTNFDHRSFDLNDEVNIAIYDPATAERVEADFSRDLAQSRMLTRARLQGADLTDRLVGRMDWLVRREE